MKKKKKKQPSEKIKQCSGLLFQSFLRHVPCASLECAQDETASIGCKINHRIELTKTINYQYNIQLFHVNNDAAKPH
jgi:hypothetical protein